MSALGEIFQRGCNRIGVETKVGPVGITNGVMGNRPHCIYRGFCIQGCKVNAKASPLVTHVPDALAHGAEIRADSMVYRVEVDERGRATGVSYLHDGRERRQRARVVAVAGYSIETPRLLLLSRSKRFPEGLCNDHDLVGRYEMVQGATQVAGRFDEEVRMYKAPPPEVSSEQFYETDPLADHKRGFSIQSVGPLPIDWAEHVTAEGHWGKPLRVYMRDYVHWATLGILAEFLPPARPTTTACRSPSSPTRSARTTSGCSSAGPRSCGRRSRRRARRTRSRSTGPRTSSAAAGWRTTSGTESATGTCAPSPSRTSTSRTAA